MQQHKYWYTLFAEYFFKGQIPCETIQIRHLDLSQNSLSGSLPSWSSETLEAVHLGQNNFSGSIPKAFLNISYLSTLDISDNRLSGRIPSAIGKLSYLTVLLVRGNRLRGTIPTQFCQLINIQLMDRPTTSFRGQYLTALGEFPLTILLLLYLLQFRLQLCRTNIEFSKKMLMCLFWEFFMIISTKLYLVINITHKMNLISLQNTGVALIRDPFLNTCLVWISLATT